MRQLRLKKPEKSGILALAPFAAQSGHSSLRSGTYDDVGLADTLRAAYVPLRHSGEEARAAIESLGGDAYLGTLATRQIFLAHAAQYRYLLLSTHAQLDARNSDYSFLAFASKRGAADSLFLRELYGQPLNAEMVVLSACQTAIGAYAKGEGVVSLARAFSYAGAKSIVTTLWKIDDAATSDIMRHFFKKLGNNSLDKKTALRQAKLLFLHEQLGQAGHPFFWAGVIGIGDM